MNTIDSKQPVYDDDGVLEQAYSIWLQTVDPITNRHGYDAVYELYLQHFPQIPLPSIRRKIVKYHQQKNPELHFEPDAPEVQSDPILEDDEDMAEILWMYHERQNNIELARNRAAPHHIYFDNGPICLVHIADTHLGSNGVDMQRLREEAEIVRDTPGMWCAFVGDLVDNFIIGKLMNQRMFTNMSVAREWLLAEHYMKMISSKLLYNVAGNHDNWTVAVSGVDKLESLNRVAELSANRSMPYDSDELNIVIHVGEAEYPTRVRHKWRLNSIYNATHDIEQAARLDDKWPFKIAIGAHKHKGAVSRSFVHDGKTRLAQNCNTYKVIDQYAKTNAFPKNNDGTVVCAILDEDGGMMYTEDIAFASRMMKLYYPKS